MRGTAKVGLAAALLGAQLALHVGAALAATDNTRVSGSDSFVARHTCADPIRVDSSWDEVMHTYYDSSGQATRLQFTGTVRITYTDLANANSYSPNSSGPSTVDLTSGDTWVRGANGAVFSDDGVLESTNGRIVYDADGNIISIVGRQVPVCAQLGTTPYSG
jgi:hypothetical protein